MLLVVIVQLSFRSVLVEGESRMTRAIQQGDGITPIVIESTVNGMHMRIGCRNAWI